MRIELTGDKGAHGGMPLSFLGIGLFLLWGYLIDLGGGLLQGFEESAAVLCRYGTLLANACALLGLAFFSKRIVSLLSSEKPMVIGVVLGTGGSAVTLLGAALEGAPSLAVGMVGSLAVGGAMAVMALIWMELYARLGEKLVAPYYAAGLLLFALGGTLVSALATTSVTVIAALVLPPISMLMARACQAEPQVEHLEAEAVTSWSFPCKPVVLIAVCCFSVRLAKALLPSAPGLLANVGDLVVAVAVLAVVWRTCDSLDIRPLYRWALPCSLATVMMALPGLPGLPGIAAVVGSAGISCLITFCMVLFCTMSYRYGINALWLFGFSRAARVFASLGGGVCADWLAAGSSQLCTVVLAAVAVILASCFMWALTENDYATTWGMVPLAPVRPDDDSTGAGMTAVEQRCVQLSRAHGLTRREEETLTLVATGSTLAQIEEQMVISKGTARVHVRHVYAKLGVHSREELLALVAQEGARV